MDVKITILIAALFNFFLAWLVYFKGRRNLANIIFALTVFGGGLWSMSLYFYEHPLFFSSLIWIKITYLLALFLILFLFYFSFIFPTSERKNLYLPLSLGIILSLPLIYILIFTRLWIKEVVIREGEVQTILGPFYIFLALYAFIFLFWIIYNLVKKYLSSSGINKERLKYLFFGIILAGLGVFLVTIIIPITTGSTRYFWLSPIFTLFFSGFFSYAITRYRLMDVRIMIGRGTVHILSFVFVIGLSLLLLFLNNKLPEPLPINIAASLILVIGISLFQPVFRFFEKIASKYFYYTFYSYQAVLTDLGKKLTQFLDLDKLSFLITNTLIETMKLDKTVILLREPKTAEWQIKKNIGFREENGISLVKDNFLTFWLEKIQAPLVYEELSLIIRDTAEKEKKERLTTLQENMKRIEAALCLPLLIEGKIIGMIVLGNKLSGDSYSIQDIELLTTLSNQASIALQNARFYSEVEDLSKNLERRVKEQTKELQKAYEELKVLDRAKSEFISMASHQLRTPLSAIKGYISMILEGSYGEISEKTKEKLLNVFQFNERLIKIVNDLLNISKVELGKMELEKSTIQIEDLIQSCYEEMKIEAEKKGLELFFEKPKFPLPKMELDPLKIRQIILNLIDNAIRYTQRGEIEIKVKRTNLSLEVSVRDTGEGMDKEEKEKIFEGFTRGAAGITYWIEGSGLGLYVAKKYLELHQGKIWVKSKGRGKGSTFYLQLPLK